MKFVADAMLGKLTRWLRILGYDIHYSNSFDDNELITIVKTENRILLTSDNDLFHQIKKHDLNAFLVKGVKREETIASIAKRYQLNLEINLLNSRCPLCNTLIRPIDKDDIKNKVHHNTFRNYDEFWECPNCQQVYWQGAHWKRIKETLRKAKKIIEN